MKGICARPRPWPERRTGSGLRAGLSIACALLLSACGGGDDESGERTTPAEPSGRAPAVDISVSAENGRERRQAQLECGERAKASGFPGGDAVRLCRTARRLAPFLAAGENRRRVCTQIYGGPETAVIRGTIEGRRIDRQFSRTDGCRIADWDRAAPLIPLKAG